jgi:hypothetical protein
MAEKLLTEEARESLVYLLVLPVLIGPSIVAWQVYTWLQTAKWQPVAVSDALNFFRIPHPGFDWLGGGAEDSRRCFGLAAQRLRVRNLASRNRHFNDPH